MDQSSKPININVEYCGGWGYYPKFAAAQQLLMKFFPNAKIEGHKQSSKTGDFEVTANGKLVHSKKNGEGFVTEQNVQNVVSKIKQTLA